MSDGSPYQPPSARIGAPPAKAVPADNARKSGVVLLLLIGFFLGVRLVNQWRHQDTSLKAAAEEEGQTVEDFLAANPEFVEWLTTARRWLGAGVVICAGYAACGILVVRYPVAARAAGILLLGTEAFCAHFLKAPYLTRAWWIQFFVAVLLLGGLLAERNRLSVARIRKRLGYEPEDG
jgi:hypothetical protein